MAQFKIGRLNWVILTIAVALLPTAAIASTNSVAPSMDDLKHSVPNFQQVSDVLYRGGHPSQLNLEQLKAHGIKTVIDLRKSDDQTSAEDAIAKKLGLNYVRIPMGYKAPSNEKIVQFLKVVNTPSMQPVYLHCRQGADRTGTLCGIYRLLTQNWTFSDVYKEMRSHHFKPFLFALKGTVQQFSKMFPEERQSFLLGTLGQNIAQAEKPVSVAGSSPSIN